MFEKWGLNTSSPDRAAISHFYSGFEEGFGRLGEVQVWIQIQRTTPLFFSRNHIKSQINKAKKSAIAWPNYAYPPPAWRSTIFFLSPFYHLSLYRVIYREQTFFLPEQPIGVNRYQNIHTQSRSVTKIKVISKFDLNSKESFIKMNSWN